MAYDLKETLTGDNIHARVWHKKKRILYLEYYYKIASRKQLTLFYLEVPVTAQNNHLKIGDKIDMQLLIKGTK